MSDDLTVHCSACGARMRLTEPVTRGRRLVRWFNYGRVPGGQRSYTCDTCGMGASVGAVYTASHARGRGLRALYDRRSMQPVPRFYAIMAVAGAVIGATWSALFSWPWWLGPVAALAGGWAFMTSTAFWHPRLHQRPSRSPGQR